MKKIYFNIGILFLCTVWSGCEDWFAKEVPPHQLVGENSITNESTAKVALNGVYSYLKDASLNSNYIMDNECRLGLMTYGNRKQFEEEYLMTGAIPEEDPNALNPWQSAYRMVNAANNFVYYAEQVDAKNFGPNRKTEMLAEARFLRAFAHATVLRKYGFFFDINHELGALIRLEPASLSNNSMPRSTVAESYLRIFEDYDYAIEHGAQFSSRFRACATTAKAFKADLLMSRGAPGDYEEAIRLADEVLADSTNFSLEKDYASIFVNGYDSKELIFSRRMDEPPTPQDNSSSIYQIFMNGLAQPSEDYYKYMDEEDARYSVTLDSAGTYPGNVRKLIWKKHYHADRDCPMYYMRLAQMLLIKAEAMLYTNAPIEDIVKVLNVLRERSGNTLFTAEQFASRELLQDEIFCENLRELGMENGNLFFVAVRMQTNGIRKIRQMNPNYNDDKLLVFPIPTSELQNNFKIEQKP